MPTIDASFSNNDISEKIENALDYDPLTGQIRWKLSPSRSVKSGDLAGCKDIDGYLRIGLYGRLYSSHRIGWFLHYGRWPKGQIDHINGRRDDNRIENIRDVTQHENGKNQRMPSSNTSGIVGVCWYKNANKWAARIIAKGKPIHLGFFDNKQDAGIARKNAEKKYGFHENHGRR